MSWHGAALDEVPVLFQLHHQLISCVVQVGLKFSADEVESLQVVVVTHIDCEWHLGQEALVNI